MGSSNLNLDLHHQEDFHGSSSFSLPWNQDFILNSGDLISNGALSTSSRDLIMRATSEMPMVQDPGFQWAQAAGHGGGEGYIKEEISDSLAKLTGINLQDYSLMSSRAKHEFNHFHGLLQPTHAFESMNLGNNNNNGRGSFSMVLPSANISSSTSCLQPLSYVNNPLGVDLQALDLLASAGFCRATSQPSLNSVALLTEDLGYGTVGQLQEPTHAPVSTSYHKASHNSVSEVTETKRSNSLDSRTSPQPPAPKKPRFESRSSFTPFKVRKEKLGDRIAALQQLVAPFGKTDTASVLMEAIGYIKFLQNQVETLSVPYMRSSNNKKTRTSQTASSEDRDEPKPDLRSRGLCLVPLSCTSYVTNENGGVWSPTNYRGGA